MTAVATFHFGAQAPGLKYLIVPSASVTATGDSVNGISQSAWSVIGTANSAIADWVISASNAHSCVVTAPSGSDKACILQRVATTASGPVTTTAKIYSGTEAPCTNETDESDPVFGWGPLVGAGGAGTPYASTPAANTPAGSAGASSDYARGDHAHPVQNPLIATGAMVFGQTSQNSSLLGDVTVVQGAASNRLRADSMLMRSAADSTKCTHTVADAYIQNYAVSCDLQSGGLSRCKVDADTVTLNTSAAGKVSICEAGAEHAYIEFASSTTRFWCLSGALNIAAGTAITVNASGGVLGLISSSWITMSGRINDNNFTTPAQWVANTDNFALTTAKNRYRASTDANRDLTGIVAPAFVGDIIKIHNIGAFNIVLKHESASSTATNRFTLPGAADVTIGPGHCAVLWYDGTSSRWFLESRT